MTFFKTKKGIISIILAVVIITIASLFIWRKQNTPENKIPAAVYKVHTTYKIRENGKVRYQDRGYSYWYFGDLKDTDQNQTSNRLLVSNSAIRSFTTPATVTNESSFNAVAAEDAYTNYTYAIDKNEIKTSDRKGPSSIIKVDKITKDGFEGIEYYPLYDDKITKESKIWIIKAIRLNDITTK